MNEIRNIIEQIVSKSNINKSKIEKMWQQEVASPFTKEQIILTYLISENIISFKDYMEIYSDYEKRYEYNNKYLYLYEMAPRHFGQVWGENHIRQLYPKFIKATKKNMKDKYPDFNGEFDLWINDIRVEVKACRANNSKAKSSVGNSLVARAYTREIAKKEKCLYHFQQLKPSCCDIFIWIGVCTDVLLYWVITSKELEESGKMSPQHRNENTGSKGLKVFEGQVFMTEEDLEQYSVNENEILIKIIEKMKK